MIEPIRKNFASDNVVPVCPEIMAAIQEANRDAVASYGGDPWTTRLNEIYSDLFETPVSVFPVTTGTACNSLALSAIVPPYGSVLCDQNAHIATEEAGAPEFFTHGAKLLSIPSDDGRIKPDSLARALARGVHAGVSTSPISALSLTQATEWGTIYTPDDIAALTHLAHASGLKVHMDGARFANAAAARGCSPADMTWRAGVDVLSFGATKNGAMAAEAVIFFKPSLADDFLRRIKRGGHLWSKNRFASAQLLAYVKDGLWLDNATRANEAAARLAAGLARNNAVYLPFETQGNEIFPVLPQSMITTLEEAGYIFYRWDAPATIEGSMIRLVTNYQTSTADVDALLATITG